MMVRTQDEPKADPYKKRDPWQKEQKNHGPHVARENHLRTLFRPIVCAKSILGVVMPDTLKNAK